MTRYLTVTDLIRINDRMTQKWGGAAGVRDQGLLESAVARPQTGYYRDLVEEAGALCEAVPLNPLQPNRRLV
ncbi:MAG: hypothetical protein M3Y24_03970 [Acidobacteriota bacterium]|nr:hypothetical protein [Acidobacteriota bacterium]